MSKSDLLKVFDSYRNRSEMRLKDNRLIIGTHRAVIEDASNEKSSMPLSIDNTDLLNNGA